MSSCSPSALLAGSRSLSTIELEPHSRIRRSSTVPHHLGHVHEAAPFTFPLPVVLQLREGEVAPGPPWRGRVGTGRLCESEFREMPLILTLIGTLIGARLTKGSRVDTLPLSKASGAERNTRRAPTWG